jgi:hypothetical protein
MKQTKPEGRAMIAKRKRVRKSGSSSAINEDPIQELVAYGSRARFRERGNEREGAFPRSALRSVELIESASRFLTRRGKLSRFHSHARAMHRACRDFHFSCRDSAIIAAISEPGRIPVRRGKFSRPSKPSESREIRKRAGARCRQRRARHRHFRKTVLPQIYCDAVRSGS